jgi:hypothetical protein
MPNDQWPKKRSILPLTLGCISAYNATRQCCARLLSRPIHKSLFSIAFEPFLSLSVTGDVGFFLELLESQ